MFGFTGMNAVKVEKNEPLLEKGVDAAICSQFKKYHWCHAQLKYLDDVSIVVFFNTVEMLQIQGSILTKYFSIPFQACI